MLTTMPSMAYASTHDAFLPERRITLSLSALARAGVVVAMLANGVVLWEPAPVDLVMIALIGLIPLAGLHVWSSKLAGYLVIWLMCGCGALLASTMSFDAAKSTIHTGVSFYLYVASFVLAGFVAHSPVAHTRLILNAYVWAALIAATAAFVGYFGLVPGAFDAFTKFGRATGTFKDPNVFGPFLIPAILYLVHVALGRRLRASLVPLSGAAVLGLGVLLSFSRGAWINLGVSVLLYGTFAFVTARTVRERTRIASLAMAIVGLAGAIVVVASQFDAVSNLMAERSSLSQGYDVGPEGRFGGQEKAKAIAVASPLGIGAGEFAARHHHEDVHNVYISMFLNAGWLGGTIYIFMVGLTFVAGFMHLLRGTPSRPLFLVAFAALLGNIFEGIVIDTDHWRHFYILLAIVWGLMASVGPPARGKSR